MKISGIFYFLFLICTLNSKGQPGQYGASLAGWLVEAMPVENKSMIVVLNDGDLKICEFDSLKNLSWQKSYIDSTKALWAADLTRTLDSGFAICGQAYDNLLQEWFSMFVKLDRYGNMDWGKGLSISGCSFNSVVQKSDSDYILTGTISNVYGNGMRDALLVSIDKNGNYKWAKCFGDPWNTQDDGKKVINTPDSAYVLLNEGFYGPNNNMILMKFSNNDSLLWIKAYDIDNSPFQASSYLSFFSSVDLINTNDNGLAVATSTFELPGVINLLAVKLDAYGNVEWSTMVDHDADESPAGIIQLIDSSYVFVGGHNLNFNISGSSIIFKLSQEGNVIWDNFTGDSAVNNYRCVFQDDLGSIDAMGQCYTTGGNSLYMSVFDTAGNGCGSIFPAGINSKIQVIEKTIIYPDTNLNLLLVNRAMPFQNALIHISQYCSYNSTLVPENNYESDLKLFPSVVQESFQIYSGKMNNYRASLRIFDINGALLFENSSYIIGSEIKSTFAPGLYMLLLQVEEKFYTFKFVVSK